MRDLFDNMAESKDRFFESIDKMISSGTKEPTICPCCEKKYRVYKKNISARVALTLADMYREAQTNWIHLPSTKRTMCQNYQDLRFWGLIEEGTKEKKRGGKNSGFWRVTSDGEAFIRGYIKKPFYAHIYNSEFVGFSGEAIKFRECFNEKFAFPEFMSREGWG